MTSTMSGYGMTPTGMASGQMKPMKEKIPSGYKKATLQQFTPEAMQLYQQMFSHLSPDSYLSKLAGGDQSFFNEMEQPALRQFGELQGNLASRFSGMGGLGARKSSGFQNTMNSAASDFAQQLQAQRVGLRNQAIKDLMGMSNELLGQRPYETSLVEKEQKKGLGGWGGAIGTGLGAAGGYFLGGPAGANVGAKIGYSAGSGFD